MKTSVVRMMLLAGMVCLSIQPIQAGENSAATVNIDLDGATPGIQTTRVAAVDDILNVDIVIQGAVDLIGFQVVVTFPPSILEVQTAEVTEGDFLKKNGVSTYFTEPTFTSGKVQVTDVVMKATVSDAEAADGDGVLVRLKFKVVSTGAAALAFSTSTSDTQILRDNSKNPGGADIDYFVTLNHAFGATVNPVVTYTLDTGVSPSGGGSVAKDPDQASYASGASVQLTATAGAGYTFTGWSGDASGSANPLTVTMNANKTVTANFAPPTTYTLNVLVSPTGGGTVAKNPDGASYGSGTTVELTATASAGYAFTGWSGDASGSSNPLTITMNSNKTVAASFTAATYALTTGASPSGGGSVAKSPDKASYSYNESVQLTATASPGYTFGSWGGDASGSSNPLTIAMNANKNVTATFTASTYTLTTGASPSEGGSVAKNPDKASYSYNESVQLTATASSGYAFASWSGGASGSSNPVTITMNSNKSATANFTGGPVLTIAKTDSPDPVDPSAQIVYTITYGNTGVEAATNTVIVETLPAGLVYVSCTGGGVYNATARTITWTIPTLPAHTTNQTADFTVTMDSSWEGGGTLTNSDLWIDCDQTDPVQAAPVTTTVNDKKGPTIALSVPTPNAEQVALKSMVRVRITDRSGVDFGGDTVKIQIEGCVIYDGAREHNGVDDSNSLRQAIRGICRRTGTATDYTFTFVPSVPYGYEKKVDVRVEATDEKGNAAQREYFFWTQTRVFGTNAKVNSDTGALVQDNPATAVDSQGNIWVVWDQTITPGNGDIYIGKLAKSGTAFGSSEAVAPDPNDQRHPTIAIDADDVVYVAWQQDDPNGLWDIYLSSSTDPNGAIWSDATKVSVGDPHAKSNQTAPAMAIDANTPTPNKLYVAFESNADGKDIVLASTPDGTTWTERVITDANAVAPSSPVVGVDPDDHTVYVLWTDSRTGGTTGTDLYGASSSDDYDNVELVMAAGDQSSPAGAVSPNAVHLAWVASLNGFGEILYANDANDTLPLVGTSIIDADEDPNIVQAAPALAVHSVFERDTVFAAWEDSRDVVANNGDTDIYFAESSSPFGTNILVNKDTGANRQTKPAVGVNAAGDPYVVWVDNRSGNNDIYYAGSRAIGNAHAKDYVKDANGVVTAVWSSDKKNLGVTISDPNVLPAGIDPCDITFADIVNPPPPPPNGFGLCYDFGPSGTEFSGAGLRIRIPLASDAPVRERYDVYWYDPNNPPTYWTTDGIDNPATRGSDLNGAYLEVKVHHFTVFGIAGVDIPDGGGGGGCALAPGNGGSPLEFSLPFVAYILVLFAVTCVDRLRRRSVDLRRR